MIQRHATVLISDELLVALSGKINLLGTYTADLTIPTNPTQLAQLVFLFIIEADVSDVYQSLTLQLTLPETAPMMQAVDIPKFPILPDRPRWTLRWPWLISHPLLRPGRIEAKIIHEKGEIIAGMPWIILTGPAAPPAATH